MYACGYEYACVAVYLVRLRQHTRLYVEGIWFPVKLNVAYRRPNVLLASRAGTVIGLLARRSDRQTMG